MNTNLKELNLLDCRRRTNKNFSMIQLLGNCAKPVPYEYTEKILRYIFNKIEKRSEIAK